MSHVLVLRHVPHEPLASIEHYLTEAGIGHRYVDLFDSVPQQLDWQAACGLIVMGGPMNVDQTERYPFLEPEITWIHAAVEAGKPFLGVCLGSQLLAKALGARVRPNGRKEIGWYPLEVLPAAADDALFTGSQPRETVFQWHGDTFDLPPGAVHLARSALCEHQAFRFGRCAYGLQFHIEMTPELVAEWLSQPGNRAELASLPEIDPEAILRETPTMFPRMAEFGQRVLRRWVGLCH